MDSLNAAIDSLVNALPADSTAAVAWINTLLPGIDPALVALMAAWLATRGIWAIKLLINVMKFVGPGPISGIFSKVQGIWSSIGWILNPLLMYLAGQQFTGSGPMGLLFAFAGIGVREWLVKSPIPTSKDELAKLKGA